MLRVPYKLRLADSVCSIDTGLADGWISIDDIEEALERPMTCRPVHSVVFNLKLDEIGVDPATLGDLLYADGCDELAEGREELGRSRSRTRRRRFARAFRSPAARATRGCRLFWKGWGAPPWAASLASGSTC